MLYSIISWLCETTENKVKISFSMTHKHKSISCLNKVKMPLQPSSV